MGKNRPFITISYSQSIDGRIATVTGQSQWISGPETLNFAHTLRRDNEAILVGIGTVLKDDPLLTCRLPGNCRSPLRIILDSHLQIPLDSKIVKSADSIPTLLCCLATAPENAKQILHEKQVEILCLPEDERGQVDLPSMLDELGSRGIRSVFVEGGAGIITSFFRLRLVDRLAVVSAPLILGEGISAVGDLGIKELTEGVRGHSLSVQQHGEDVVWEIHFQHKTNRERQKAHALYFTAEYTVELREEIVEPKNGEVLVVSQLMALSHGTERHVYEGSFPRGGSQDDLASLALEMRYPLKYGYMNAGVSPRGDRVFAFFPHQDKFYYPEEELIIFPENLDFEDIVLYPSMETAYNIVLDAAPLQGERILIVGMGMIGMLVGEILAAMKGLHVSCLEKDPFRREMAATIGISGSPPTDLQTDELRNFLSAKLGGGAPDLVIHTSGTAQGLQSAIDCAGFEGRIIEASWYGAETVELSLGEAFHRKRLRLFSSQVSSVPGTLGRTWNKDRRKQETMDWLHRIRPGKYISHRYPFSQSEQAFKDLLEPPEGFFQAVLIPDELFDPNS